MKKSTVLLIVFLLLFPPKVSFFAANLQTSPPPSENEPAEEEKPSSLYTYLENCEAYDLRYYTNVLKFQEYLKTLFPVLAEDYCVQEDFSILQDTEGTYYQFDYTIIYQGFETPHHMKLFYRDTTIWYYGNLEAFVPPALVLSKDDMPREKLEKAKYEASLLETSLSEEYRVLSEQRLTPYLNPQGQVYLYASATYSCCFIYGLEYYVDTSAIQKSTFLEQKIPVQEEIFLHTSASGPLDDSELLAYFAKTVPGFDIANCELRYPNHSDLMHTELTYELTYAGFYTGRSLTAYLKGNRLIAYQSDLSQWEEPQNTGELQAKCSQQAITQAAKQTLEKISSQHKIVPDKEQTIEKKLDFALNPYLLICTYFYNEIGRTCIQETAYSL